jgi:hypothetical protein
MLAAVMTALGEAGDASAVAYASCYARGQREAGKLGLIDVYDSPNGKIVARVTSLVKYDLSVIASTRDADKAAAWIDFDEGRWARGNDISCRFSGGF